MLDTKTVRTDIPVPGSYGCNISRFVNAHTSAALTPYVSSSGNANSDSWAVGMSTLAYAFSVIGPTVSVPIDIRMRGFAHAVGFSGEQAGAQIDLDGSGIHSFFAYDFEYPGANARFAADPSCSTASVCQLGGFDVTVTEVVQTDGWETVLLFAYTGVNNGTGQAWVDPLITIDPSVPNRGDYHIQFSPGILNQLAVPEPASVVILLGGLAFASRRKRRG